MKRQFVFLALILAMGLAVSLAHAEPREKEGKGGKGRGGKPAGESQAERRPEGRQSNESSGRKELIVEHW